jgi:CelD/BcsL family acetyltransferase involved in cellulose biosynthesis
MSSIATRIVASLDALPAPARELWLREEPALQFDQTLGWSELLARYASEPGESLRIICALDATDRCVGLLPLKLGTREGSFGLRYARALANYYSSVYAPIIARDAEREAVLRALLSGVRSLAPAVDALDLNPLPAGEHVADRIAALLQTSGWSTERYFRFGNWYLEVAGRSYTTYFGGLASQLRNTVTRKDKKLRAQAGATIGIARSPEEAERALADYQRIYAASWKKAEPHPNFVPSLVRFLAARGWLRLGWVRLGEEAAAAQIWAVKDGVASIFKLAYDERFAQLSAGSVLTAELMKHVLDVDRVRIVDYLTGDDSYKRDWMSHRQERVGVRAYRHSSPRGALAACASAARAWLRRGKPADQK